MYQFVRMPFVLCNAPATFQRAMDKIFAKENDRFIIPYFDDIIIFSETIENHMTHLKMALDRIKSASLRLNKNKCKISVEEIKILGNIVSYGKIKTDPAKIEAIQQCKIPAKIKELRSFLGLANYCRPFLPKFATIAAPLFNLLKGESKRSVKTIKWYKDSSQSFYTLKGALLKSTERPQPDLSQPFILTTDASDKGIGAILSQRTKYGNEKMISAFSKTLDKSQMNYGITDRGLLAVVKAVDHYRPYLLGKKFLLKTDHKALTYLWTAKDPTTRLLRWAMKLQEYSFDVEYIKGETNAADELIRLYNCSRIESRLLQEVGSVEEQAMILRDYHLSSVHSSATNMKFLIKEKYIWPRMYKDIEEYVKSYPICSKAGGPRINTKNKIIESDYSNEVWVCDLIGRFPLTSRNNQYIIVLIDHYSK